LAPLSRRNRAVMSPTKRPRKGVSTQILPRAPSAAWWLPVNIANWTSTTRNHFVNVWRTAKQSCSTSTRRRFCSAIHHSGKDRKRGAHGGSSLRNGDGSEPFGNHWEPSEPLAVHKGCSHCASPRDVRRAPTGPLLGASRHRARRGGRSLVGSRGESHTQRLSHHFALQRSARCWPGRRCVVQAVLPKLVRHSV
jgi:hypothetical protein